MRERETHTQITKNQRQTERQTDRDRDRVRDRQKEREEEGETEIVTKKLNISMGWKNNGGVREGGDG